MFKSANPYDLQRLTDKNIQNYILSSYFNYDNISLKSVNQLAIQPFAQHHFEENGIITSIAMCVYHYCSRSYDISVIYNAVESIAKKYHNNPLFTKIIYEEALDYFKIPHKKIKSKYINHIGFNYNTIKQQINQQNPVILYLFTDNRGYYKSHTLTIVGYIEFNLFDNFARSIINQNKVKRMLLVYDTWTEETSYLDSDIISPISCITF